MAKIFLNGQETEVPDGLSIATLLEWLKLPTDRVAVERNLVIVSRGEWAGTAVQTGDRLEVVHFVGGGGSCGPSHSDEYASKLKVSRRGRTGIDAASQQIGHH